MQILTVICLCENSFVVTQKELLEALKHPSAPYITCGQLIGTGITSKICNRKYSAMELEKFFGRKDVLIVKDEKDMQLELIGRENVKGRRETVEGKW